MIKWNKPEWQKWQEQQYIIRIKRLAKSLDEFDHLFAADYPRTIFMY